MRSLAIAIMLIICGLSACETISPPTPPEEQAGYAAAGRVIAALEKFRQEHSNYPATLRELVPRYIRHIRQSAVAVSTEDQRNLFNYYFRGDAYSLAFTYFTASGAEVRSYNSQTKKWHNLHID